MNFPERRLHQFLFIINDISQWCIIIVLVCSYSDLYIQVKCYPFSLYTWFYRLVMCVMVQQPTGASAPPLL